MTADPELFLSLLKPGYDEAVAYTRALCSKDRNDADDVFQQAILIGIEKLSGLRDQSKFRSWFFKIITRCFYRHYRKTWFSLLIPTREEVPIGIFDGEERDDRADLIYAALGRLNSKERAAILLFELGDFSIREIMEIQEEKSPSAVKSRLSRTREKLKKAILDLEKNQRTTETKDFTNDLHKIASGYGR